MTVIAHIHNVDPEGVKFDAILALRETPFPGDTIAMANGSTVRVLRREFAELVGGGDNQVDVELGVRPA